MAAAPTPVWMLAIDPGEQHTGVAQFRLWTDGTGWRGECVAAWEAPPDEVIAHLAGVLDPSSDHQPKIGVLVVEEWRLYEDRMANLVGTEILTIEVIGVIRYLWRASVRRGSGCEWIQHGARVKTGTRKILRAKQIRSRANGSTHGKDAELHGWYHLMHTLGGQPGDWEDLNPKKPAKRARK